MTKKLLLEQARRHWDEATTNSAERANRERGREDAKFSSGADDGAQWDSAVYAERRANRRPCITVNRMVAFLHRVENEVRQNKIAIRISPVDSGIDKDTAEVDQGLVRHIENDSVADSSAHAALVEACRSGLGVLKVVAEYVGDDSFDQKLCIEYVPDAIQSVWFDPYAMKPDKSDGRYVFESQRIARDDFKVQYPDCETVSSGFFDALPQTEGWITSDDVLVAHYWYFEIKKRKLLYLAETGQTVFEDELGELDISAVSIEKEREVTQKTVKCCKFNGCEILEETEWPGEYIPVVPVVGEEIMVEGSLKRYSLIHFAKDSQRLFNYYRSSEAEMVGLAPKAPWIGVEGQFAGHEREWKTANTAYHAYLEYCSVNLHSGPAPPPARTPFEPQIQALSIGAAQSADDMKSSTGIFDANLGARSNETSGIAIQRRQAEGDLANLHFIDNLKRAKVSIGRILIGAKSHYYDTARQIEILGEDMKPKVVRINEQYVDENGRERNFKISDTRYNVTVSTGPSYNSARTEAFAAQTEYVKAFPELMMIAGDLVMRNSDAPGSDQIADRIKKAIDPKLTEEESAGAAKIPPAVKAAMAEMDQTIAALTEQLNKATDELTGKKLEMESKERIAHLEASTAITIAERKLGSVEGIELLRQEVASINQRMQLLHASETLEAEHSASAASQMQDQAHEQSMQGADLEASAAAQAAETAAASEAQASTQAHQTAAQMSDQAAASASQDSAQKATASQATQAQKAAAEQAKAAAKAKPKPKA